MDTITFRTTPQNGSIQIPLQYQQDLQNTETVEVVLHKVKSIPEKPSLEEPSTEKPSPEKLDADIKAGWDQLMQLIEENTMDTGIEDLAHQHDHYLHNKPKQSR